MLSAYTNAFQNGDTSPAWDFSRNRRDPSDGINPINGGLKKPAFMEGAPPNSGPDNRTLAGQNQNGNQSMLFDSPTPLPAPNAAQQLSLERFRQLLGASPSPAPAAVASSSDKIFPLPEMSPDVKLDQPLQNSVGASFAPLNSSVGKLPTLPTLPSYLGSKLHIIPTGRRLGTAAAAVDIAGPAAFRCSATKILTPAPVRG